MASAVEVSIVLPAYNEEGTIEHTVSRTLETLERFLSAESFEVIIAEDGSDDDTPVIAARLAAGDDRIRHIHADDRLGRGRALTRAFRIAQGDVLAYLDTDLATDMDHLEELVESIRSENYAIATGSRWIPGHQASRPLERKLPSRIYNGLVRLLLRSRIRDHQCGFKAFDRDALFSLLDTVNDDHWFWDTELLVRGQRAGYSIREFPVEWQPQQETTVDFVRDVLGMGSGIIRTWWDLTVRPRITPKRSIAAGILLTAAAVALMTVYLDFSLVINRMRAAVSRNPALVVAATLMYGLSWPLRGARYRDILAELGFHEHIGFLTGAVFISQTGNLVFPARAGDVVRAYIVKTRRNVPYPTGFASLAIERVFDLLTITALAGIVLLGLAASGTSGFYPPGSSELGAIARSGRVAMTVAAAVGILAITAVTLIVTSARSDRNRIRPVIRQFSDDSYALYVAAVIERFVSDVQTVAADHRTFIRVSAASLVIWGIDVTTALTVLAAFEPAVPLPTLVVVSFFAVSVGNLAKVLPLSPGGIGLYEGAFTLLVVGLTGLPVGLVLGAAIVDHAIKNAVTVTGGVVSMIVLNVSLTAAVEEGHDVHSTDPG